MPTFLAGFLRAVPSKLFFWVAPWRNYAGCPAVAIQLYKILAIHGDASVVKFAGFKRV